MNKINLKNFYLNLVIILIVFTFDRATKLYILKLAEVETSVDVYINPYLNLFLIWNKGIAFGFFSTKNSSLPFFLLPPNPLEIVPQEFKKRNIKKEVIKGLVFFIYFFIIKEKFY